MQNSARLTRLAQHRIEKRNPDSPVLHLAAISLVVPVADTVAAAAATEAHQEVVAKAELEADGSCIFPMFVPGRRSICSLL